VTGSASRRALPDARIAAMFSGGSYDDVARWLRMFLNSHAKREDPRVEAELDTEGERDGVSYGARLRFEDRTTDVRQFDYKDVAANRGRLDWCATLAEQVREQARRLLAAADVARR